MKNKSKWVLKTLEKIGDKDYQKRMEDKGVKAVIKGAPDYPERLMQYNEAPEFLFYKGNLPDFTKTTVAIIGARACSNYGRSITKMIARDLSVSGVQVISGLARGIDSYAALGALEGGTPTFVVLGSGVDVCYPAENIELYHRILESGGGIISEYPLGEDALPWHFPARNRIISGLADKVFVVEAKERSGSLITVEWALEQGKDVCALPGRVGDKLSEGCNKLIKSGAQLVTSAKDILEDMRVCSYEEKSIDIPKNLTSVYSAITLEPKGIDELITETKIPYEEIVTKLLELQMMGCIKQLSDGFYCLK